MFEELAQFGELENVNVCDNLADHMVGNVYVKFREEEAAAKALAAFQVRAPGACCHAARAGLGSRRRARSRVHNPRTHTRAPPRPPAGPLLQRPPHHR